MTQPEDAFARFMIGVRGETHDDPRLSENIAFGADPGNLRMLSYVPAGAEPGAPLVIVLHGCTQNASLYAAGAGWLDLAERYGFAVLAPEQRQENNPRQCFTWFDKRDVARDAGEVGSIVAMMAHMLAAHRLDPRRVFVTGLSAGGAMTCALLAAHPELFAAGAVIGGLPYGSADGIQQAFGAMMRGRERAAQAWGDHVRNASAHQGPWPKISIWHGDADRTVAPANAHALVAQWLDVHGAPPAPVLHETEGGYARTVWGDGAVELHLIAGFGHGTPVATVGEDACGAPGPFLLDCGISSSARIAATWGLIGKASPRAAEAPPAPEPQKVTRRPAPTFSIKGVDIGAVIKSALSKAGLIKR